MVYNAYFDARVNERYLEPIKLINKNKSFSGEGFSVMAIICTLIEFLESTYQGKSYKIFQKGAILSQFEYSLSRDVFIDFLVKRFPFSTEFNRQTALNFYSDVRCGLLHEARTKGKWKIKVSNSMKLIEINSKESIIYRNNFYVAIEDYVKNIYKNELLKSQERKEAFLRKFDSLCNE